MKAGRVIGGDEHDAKQRAERLLAEARAQADALVADAQALATTMVSDARREVARAAAASDDERAWQRPADDTSNPTRAVDVPAGTVDEVVGLLVRATIPRVALGELVRIDRRDRDPLPAEVVGFRGEQAVLLPLGELAGVAPASIVWRTGRPLQIRCGDDLLGRVLDGTGAPVDGGPALVGETWDVDRSAPSPLERPVITAPLPTGVRALDTLLTLARGQRIGLFAAAGVGKSTLLGQIARSAAADVIVM
jgi:flagellar biosynthesis/type III secretory pathway ATPase